MDTETIIVRLGVFGDGNARHLMAYDGPLFDLWDGLAGRQDGPLQPLCGQPGDYYQLADYVLTRGSGLCLPCLKALVQHIEQLPTEAKEK